MRIGTKIYRAKFFGLVLVSIPTCWIVFNLEYYSSIPAIRNKNFPSQDFKQHAEEQNLIYPQETTENLKEPRRSIIIISHGRSGSSIIGDIFNQHKSVFYFYEPLQTAQRISGNEVSRQSYNDIMTKVLTSTLRCEFNDEVTADIESYYRENPNASIAMNSPPLCPLYKHPELCPRLTSEKLGNACRNFYDVTVIKILFRRFDKANIRNVLDICDTHNIDCKIIFLIRDPRAVIASARSVRFFRDIGGDTENTNFRLFANKLCNITVENLKIVHNLESSWKKRLMIVRYEDFAMDPLKMLSKLYNFANLPEQEGVKDWLYQRTQGKGRAACKGIHPVFCTIDDAMKAINRWRLRIPIEKINVMEECCQLALQMNGYKLIRGYNELKSNTNIPLF